MPTTNTAEHLVTLAKELIAAHYRLATICGSSTATEKEKYAAFSEVLRVSHQVATHALAPSVAMLSGAKTGATGQTDQFLSTVLADTLERAEHLERAAHEAMSTVEKISGRKYPTHDEEALANAERGSNESIH